MNNWGKALGGTGMENDFRQTILKAI